MKKVGKVVGVCVSQKRTDPKMNVGQGFLRQGFGLVGDSHGGSEKEVSLLAVESIRRLSEEALIVAGPGSFAENITTEDMELTLLPIGSGIEVGDAKLRVIQIGKDASHAHTYHYQGYSILPREGIFCKVVKSGRVKIGDPIRLSEG